MNAPKPAHPALSTPVVANTIPFPRKDNAAKTPGKLERLVALEGEIRNLPTRSAVAVHAVNAPRDLIGFENAFFIAFNRNGKARLESASSVATVDAQAPLVRALVKKAAQVGQTQKTHALDLTDLKADHGYPNCNGAWVPFLDQQKKVFGGLLLSRPLPWEASELAIADRCGQTYAHAVRALSPPSLIRTFALPRPFVVALLLSAAALMLVPVKLTVLAPFEVVPLAPHVVTAPIDGVIAQIDALPNSPVVAGQILYRFDATVLQAEADIAAQKVQVSAARLATAQNGAFTDEDMKRSVAVSAKELDVANAELAYADSLLKRVKVRARKNGMLIFSSVTDWLGKPVRTGEKVMEIADPLQVVYRVDLGVRDSIALQQGNTVRLFLDADPLRPRDAVISELSYHASPLPDGQLAYRVMAKPHRDDGTPPRVGLRGTAQISGDQVSLGFYLLRRPIAAVRQSLGL